LTTPSKQDEEDEEASDLEERSRSAQKAFVVD